jgi:hypothetical protein
MKKQIKVVALFTFIFALIYFVGGFMVSNFQRDVEVYPTEQAEEVFTDMTIQNVVEDSVKVYLTLQSTKSVVGLFGIKASDTTGSASQGYFYAKKDSIYHLNYKSALEGWKISFETYPTDCRDAIKRGYPNGINVIEGSINVAYESFDNSCVDGINCIVKMSVTDTTNWTTGINDYQERFYSSINNIKVQSNLNVRGIFPYRCTDCVDIDTANIPPNCFNLPNRVNAKRVCQVNRVNHIGGSINVVYYGKESICND